MLLAVNNTHPNNDPGLGNIVIADVTKEAGLNVIRGRSKYCILKIMSCIIRINAVNSAFFVIGAYKGENLRHDNVQITVNIFSIKSKIICDQIRKSATSPVLQGRFQCHKKQLARIYVIDLK